MTALSIRIPDDLKARLEQLATAEERSVSQYVRRLLNDAITARTTDKAEK